MGLSPTSAAAVIRYAEELRDMVVSLCKTIVNLHGDYQNEIAQLKKAVGKEIDRCLYGEGL